MIINVKVTPKAKKNIVKVEKEDFLRVYVTTPAHDGKANKALIELLANHFDVSKSSISILSGKKFRQKVVRINK